MEVHVDMQILGDSATASGTALFGREQELTQTLGEGRIQLLKQTSAIPTFPPVNSSYDRAGGSAQNQNARFDSVRLETSTYEIAEGTTRMNVVSSSLQLYHSIPFADPDDQSKSLR